MNWKDVQCEANRFRVPLKQRWPALTDDDLQLLTAEKGVFLARLHLRAGGELAEVAKACDELLSNLDLDRRHVGVIHLTAG